MYMENTLDVGPLAMGKTNMKKGDLAGEVALVTGGAGNVGLGTARSLAWLGAKVVLADVNLALGKQAEELINKECQPGTALFVLTDVSDEAAMNNLAQKAFDAFGKVDILVNTAMDMSIGGPILKTTVQQLDREYAIAARGTLLGIRLFLPGMQQRHHGVITYMSTAFRYPVGPSSYCAVKTAATSIMMSLANELGPVKDTGISIFTFLPAGVGIPRSSRRLPNLPPQPGASAKRPSFSGYEGIIPPEDCGAALAYCITRAVELHGSGVTITHAFRQMNWPYPNPETVQNYDFQRMDDRALSLVFTLMGPGFPDPKVPLNPINRK